MKVKFPKRIYLIAGLTALVAIAITWLSCNPKTPIDPTKSLQDNFRLLTDMSANPVQIVMGGNPSTISVKLIDQQGNPVVGETITFSTTQGIITTSATTNANGIAQTTLLSGTDKGDAVITAKYGVNVSTKLTVKILSLEEGRLRIETENDFILANGIDSTRITVTLVGDSSKPVEGALIYLTRTSGKIASTVVTGGDGRGVATLFSSASEEDLTATITATYDTSQAQVAVDYKGITLAVNANPQTILIGGQNSSTITAFIKETTSNIAVSQGKVTYSTSLGTIPNAATTNSSGLASVELTSGDVVGNAMVIVRYGETLRDTVNVGFSTQTTSLAILTDLKVDTKAVLANGLDKAAFQTYVVDNRGNPLQGQAVTFTTNSGTFSSTSGTATTLITGSDGSVKANLISAASRSNISAIVIARLGTQVRTSTVLFEGLKMAYFAQPASILADGKSTTTITYILKKAVSNEAVPNGTVHFGATLGTIPGEKRTNASGIITTTLVSSTTTGLSEVVARYGDVLLDTVNVLFTTESATTFILSDLFVSKKMLLANGIDQSLITAYIVDNAGNYIADQVVSFVTSHGSMSVTNAVSDENGRVQVNIISDASRNDVTADITATLGTQTKTVRVYFEGLTSSLVAEPRTILADGKSSTTITYILKKTTSKQGVPNGIVKFGATYGTLPSRATTNASGVAKVTLVSSTSPANSEIVASYGQVLYDTTHVSFSNEAPSEYNVKSITVAQSLLLANGTDKTAVTALVHNDQDNPAEGVQVIFSANSGSFAAPVNTDRNGLATAFLTSVASVTDVHDFAFANLNGHKQDSVAVSYTGLTLTLDANPDTILAGGQAIAKIRAILKATSSNIAIASQQINFGTTAGTIPGKANTNISGVAEVDLTSSQYAATAVITASYGHLPQKITTVFCENSTPTYINVTATPLVLTADGQSTSTLRASINDANNNPVPDGNVVKFSINGPGTLVSPQKPTIGGIATNTLIAGTTPDTAWITISINSLKDSIKVQYKVGAANQITVESDSTKLQANGQEAATIEAKVLDAQGTPIEDATVNFTTNIGDVTPTSQTNTLGVATATFSSGVVGTAVIVAAVDLPTGGAVTGRTTIILTPGLPNSIILNFDPVAIGVKGTGQNQTAIIEADVRDAKNNPVEDSTMINFSIVHGPGGGEALTPGNAIPTVGGKARCSISSGTISGNVRVKASTVVNGNEIVAKSSEILIHAGPPYMADRNTPATTHLTIRAERLNIWSVLGTTKISIFVTDKYHNPVQKGTAVYLTASGGGISTHTAYTDENGKAQVLYTGANPQPTISNYYYGDLVQNPNFPGTILPGPVQYPDLNYEWLLPNFDGVWDVHETAYYPASLNGNRSNSMSISDINNCSRYHDLDKTKYINLENDGIARIIAYTEGRDVSDATIRVWDQLTIISSGAVSYADDSQDPNDTPPGSIRPYSLHGQNLSLGDYAVLVFRLVDDNGNPVSSGTEIELGLTNNVDAKLSWTKITTGSGWGTGYYQVTISNKVDPKATEPKLGYTEISVHWKNDYLNIRTSSNYGVYITAPAPPPAVKASSTVGTK